MKIIPVGERIYLGAEVVKKVGDLDVSSKKTVRQVGIVEAVGPDVKSVKPKDKILFEAWGLASVPFEGEEHFFINESSNAICAVLGK